MRIKSDHIKVALADLTKAKHDLLARRRARIGRIGHSCGAEADGCFVYSTPDCGQDYFRPNKL